jgi:uncharacterized membrane protein YhaH (DUF805 family)
MREEIKQKLREARLKYIKFMAKYGRGRNQFGIYNDLFQLTTMIGLQITLWNQAGKVDWWIFHFTFPQIPLAVAYPIVIFLMVFFVIWGFIDQRILKLTQAENAYAHEALDTWLVKQFDDIKKEIKELREKIK